MNCYFNSKTSNLYVTRIDQNTFDIVIKLNVKCIVKCAILLEYFRREYPDTFSVEYSNNFTEIYSVDYFGQ